MVLKCLLVLVAFTLTVNVFHFLLSDDDPVSPPENDPDDIDVGETDGTPVGDWLASQGLSQHLHVFHKHRLDDLFQCSRVEKLPRLEDEEHQRRLEEAARKLKKKLILEHWLENNHWGQLAALLAENRVGSLKELKEMDEVEDVSDGLMEDLEEAKDYLPPLDGLAQLEALVWTQLMQRSEENMSLDDRHRLEHGHIDFRFFFAVLAIILASWLVWELGLTPVEMVFGAPVHKCITRIEWPEDMTTANTKTLNVSFYTMKGRPFDVSGLIPNLTADAWHQYHSVQAFVAQGAEPNVAQLVFTSRVAGMYYLTMRWGSLVVRGFPTHCHVEVGEVNPSSSVLAGVRSSTLVLTAAVPDTIQIEPRDKFGNAVSRAKLPPLAERFSMKLIKRLGEEEGSEVGEVNFLVYHTPILDTLCASMNFNLGQEGWYKAVILLDGQPISNAELTLIVLTRQERAKVNRCVENPDAWPQFEAEMIALNGSPLTKPKSVFCALTSKQLAVKDYLLKIFPRRLYTYRLVPATKVVLVRYSGSGRHPVIRLEDGFQPKPELVMKSGNIMAASYHLMLLNKIGGSESFGDKQTFFNAKLLKHHQSKGHKHNRVAIRVDRSNIIASSIKATRWFSNSDWCKLFEVEFEGELGIDHGGVRREWFEVLSKALFHPNNGLFASVEENSEAVYPNSKETKSSKLFKFAGLIVGKCLYESAHGVTYRQHLPARLAKSFLVQLVGLRVHYRHFADDAPELYTSKVRFIENNSVEGLDMTFTDEETAGDGKSPQEIELVPGGAKIAVTDANKMEYLDLLAQHRLSVRIRDQTEQFLAGLHTLIPDSLLSLFDESELELMLCGVREYSLQQLKEHHSVEIGSSLSSRTVEWFWLALSSFSPEQFARLLQFTTGSSQLPPGGFGELKPLFQICASMNSGSLPTAHTCFNMICLSEHNSFKDFEQSLLTAINEGSEGFGFA